MLFYSRSYDLTTYGFIARPHNSRFSLDRQGKAESQSSQRRGRKGREGRQEKQKNDRAGEREIAKLRLEFLRHRSGFLNGGQVYIPGYTSAYAYIQGQILIYANICV